MKNSKPIKKCKTFRHGDLRNALLIAGLEMARAGGPKAVILREATRQAGVSPNAAYRHFANQSALLDAVRSACISQLAVAIEDELKKCCPGRDPKVFARKSLRRKYGISRICIERNRDVLHGLLGSSLGPFS